MSTNAILFWGFTVEAGEDDHNTLEDDDGEELGGCMVGYHCSAEYPLFYVAIAQSEVAARRGYPKKVVSLAVDDRWQAKLDAFCEKKGIAAKPGGWHLVSYWG